MTCLKAKSPVQKLCGETHIFVQLMLLVPVTCLIPFILCHFVLILSSLSDFKLPGVCLCVFRSVMEKSFLEYYDFYEGVCKDRLHLQGQNMQVTIVTQFSDLICMFNFPFVSLS